MTQFDYIIIGGGASGLLLAESMGSDPWFREKRIALIERDKDKPNDRTWCFWEPENGRFDDITHRRWKTIRFKDSEYDSAFPIAPLEYKMLRGADFYREWNKRISEYPNISYINASVTNLEEQPEGVLVHTAEEILKGNQVFTSVNFGEIARLMKPYPVLQQHFIGWIIKTNKPVFVPETPLFMDFSVSQMGNTRFMYVLPFAEDEALLEYTLFSADILSDFEYEKAIREYIKENLAIDNFEILDREKGVIPMTCNDFSAADSKSITHIGIAGGWAKPSTGYTFWSSTQKTLKLIEALKNGGSLKMMRKDRFWFYDLIMLEVLANNNGKGSQIFGAMFRKLPATLILRFLHEQTTFKEELRVIWACPKLMFIRALGRTTLKRLF